MFQNVLNTPTTGNQTPVLGVIHSHLCVDPVAAAPLPSVPALIADLDKSCSVIAKDKSCSEKVGLAGAWEGVTLFFQGSPPPDARDFELGMTDASAEPTIKEQD